MGRLTWLKKGYFAHRGLHNESIPENTKMAFLNAVDNDYSIEFDIRITKDNKLIVFHDRNLLRLCGVNIDIEKALYDDIKDFKIKCSDETIPLLIQALEVIPEKTKLLIELKSSKKYKIMVSLFLKTMSYYDYTYAVQSFDFRIINLFKKEAPRIARGNIVKNCPFKATALYNLIQYVLLNILTKPDFINYRFEELPNVIVDKLKNKGYLIFSYAVRNEQELIFMRERYDNAVFEAFMPEIKKAIQHK